MREPHDGQAGAKPPGPEDHLYLIDGSGYIFRAYHALPQLTRGDGLPVGAVSGFCNMLHKLIEDTKSGESVTHIAVIFDSARRNFRNDIYPAYKANREEPPADDGAPPPRCAGAVGSGYQDRVLAWMAAYLVAGKPLPSPVFVPVPSQCTAAKSQSATTSSTVIFRSGATLRQPSAAARSCRLNQAR